MFNSTPTTTTKKTTKNVEDFLKQTEEARNKRQFEKQKIHSVIRIQAFYRGYRSRVKTKETFRNEINQVFDFVQNKEITKSDAKTNASVLYALIQKFLFIEKLEPNKSKVFENICKYLTFSIVNCELKFSYISLVVSKENYQNFLKQSKLLLKICIDNLKKLNIKDVNDVKTLNIHLNFVVTLTTHQMWKCFPMANNELLEKMLNGVANSYLVHSGNLNIYEAFYKILLQNMLNYKPILKPTLTASIVNLSLRILQINNFSHQMMLSYCSNILMNPALVKHLIDTNSNEIIQLFKEVELCNRIYSVLSIPEKVNTFLKDKDLNQSIGFLGNLSSLAKIDLVSLRLNVEIFITLSTIIFEHCCEIVEKSKGQNNTIWHPFVGYINSKSSLNHSEALLHIFEQLKFLWNHQFITILFDSTSPTVENVTKANFKGFVKGIFDKALKKEVNQLSSQESSSIFRICSFYRKLLFLFSEPRIEILSALSVEEELILGLWRFISSLGPSCGLKDLIRLLEAEHKFNHPIFDVIYLFTSLTQYLVTIFDEYEFYEKQSIFRIDDYKIIASFLNNFLYKIISNELIDLKSLDSNNYFLTFHQLLSILHDKDNQRTFTSNADYWIIKDVKMRSFICDFEKEKLSAVTILNKIPHIIPHKYRVEILQNIVQRDKVKTFGDELSQVRIKIRRNRVVEDGYQQLANLPTEMFKSTIRVVFVNEYGLNEAGIDQDGVFKEFVQEILKKILNPEFNLFKVTEEQQLYPSPSSYYVDDHLKLFEFVGRVFAKAIYEGVVVDVQFAPFFLRQIVGYRCQNYSFFDDLATLDRDLYKNLSLIKREMDEETLSSLELTFTYSESHLGSLVTHDLAPSGSFIKVNSDNKIKYIHLLALFKLHKQIKKQVFAFNEGFKSIIKQEWLNMFSIPEVQRLISGSCQDIDFEDLKKHVQYWGGLHSGHRLIKWLWELLENEFDREERGLFLKFVTSCSKPPLLGFASLNPPFTIRCVEVEEAEGTIYDASLTGFFKTIMNINNKDTSRLPTSSTCFNLLKLPNYSKKSTLREKLRYAIRSNAGFELS